MGKAEKDFLKMLKKLLKEGQSITEALESFGYIPDRGEITFLNTVDEPEVRAALNG